MSKNPSKPTKDQILQLKEDIQQLKKKLRKTEQDVYRLAAEKALLISLVR